MFRKIYVCDPEAVKPYLKREEFALYQLIWNRFMASQMSPAVVEETAFSWGADKPPGHRVTDTVIYEAHVKGLTQQHPQVPHRGGLP